MSTVDARTVIDDLVAPGSQNDPRHHLPNEELRSSSMLHSLYIINKAGGLIYQQDLSAAAPRLSSNDHLRLGSTFHSMHAIAALVRHPPS